MTTEDVIGLRYTASRAKGARSALRELTQNLPAERKEWDAPVAFAELVMACERMRTTLATFAAWAEQEATSAE